jgi:glutathione S-transferase
MDDRRGPQCIGERESADPEKASMPGMTLWFAPTSPFARKVRIAASELGLAGNLTLERVDPWTDPRLRAINPLAKVPTLQLADGTILFESAVICDYLDAQSTVPLCPGQGPERWQALLVQGLADGAMIAAGRLFADERRPANERSAGMMRRFADTRDSALDWLEGQPMRPDPRIGEVAVAAYLAYLDFRWPGLGWRARRPRLARWFERFAERPSMMSTAYALT